MAFAICPFAEYCMGDSEQPFVPRLLIGKECIPIEGGNPTVAACCAEAAGNLFKRGVRWTDIPLILVEGEERLAGVRSAFAQYNQSTANLLVV